jgi:hypothetical protein
VSAASADGAGGPEFDPESFQPSLDWEVLGVRTRDIMLTAGAGSPQRGGGGSGGDDDNSNRFGITIGEGRRDTDAGAHIVAIDNTGPAAALGRVYVGDVILEVNGLLALYSEPSEVDEMLRFATGDVRLKLCAAADLRACLHAEDSVDSHGDALAHEDEESVAASIMASLYQMHDGDERDDAENQAESAPESDTASADSSWLSATAEAPTGLPSESTRDEGASQSPARTWDDFLAKAAVVDQSREDLFTASDDEGDDANNSNDTTDCINESDVVAPAALHGTSDASLKNRNAGESDCDADATAAVSPRYSEGLIDLMLTPKAVVDELKVCDFSLGVV